MCLAILMGGCLFVVGCRENTCADIASYCAEPDPAVVEAFGTARIDDCTALSEMGDEASCKEKRDVCRHRCDDHFVPREAVMKGCWQSPFESEVVCMGREHVPDHLVSNLGDHRYAWWETAGDTWSVLSAGEFEATPSGDLFFYEVDTNTKVCARVGFAQGYGIMTSTLKRGKVCEPMGTLQFGWLPAARADR